jgi:hypothetical protein
MLFMHEKLGQTGSFLCAKKKCLRDHLAEVVDSCFEWVCKLVCHPKRRTRIECVLRQHKQSGRLVIFQVLTALSMKVSVFWDCPDDGGSKHL